MKLRSWLVVELEKNYMSQKGIRKFAEAMTAMQLARHELISMGTKKRPISRSAKQDIRLGQLLDEANGAVREKFAKITLEET